MLKSILLACFCGLIGFLGAQTNSQELESKLTALYAPSFKDGEPGGAILLQQGEKVIVQESFGLADLETREKITGNTLFNIGSISKTFVAYAILILHERGMLELDDPLNKFFPDFKHDSLAGLITLEHLMTHSSGMPDVRGLKTNPKFFMTAKDPGNWAPMKQVDTLKFVPGSQWDYLNPSFNGLALIVEQVGGMPWQDFVRENIFEPSGMDQSDITDGPHPSSGVAHAYQRKDTLPGSPFIEYDYGEFVAFPAAGNGGVWSSVTDLAKYELAIHNHAFLGPELIRASRTLHRPETWSAPYEPFMGYSWFLGQMTLVYPFKDLSVEIIHHTGSQGGFESLFIAAPEADIVFIALFNRHMENYYELVDKTVDLLEEYKWLMEEK